MKRYAIIVLLVVCFCFQTTVTAQTARRITAAEYFWGVTDPGIGQGNPVYATDGNFEEALEQLYAGPLNTPVIGLNILNIRVKDQAGRWGPVFKSIISNRQNTLAPDYSGRLLTAGEYYWGTTDPGQGNGTPLLSADGQWNSSMERFLSGQLQAPNLGTNLLNIRVKTRNGKWGPVYKSQIYVDVPAVPQFISRRLIVAAEYFWGNQDPGAGQGIPVLASDGNLDEGLEQLYANNVVAGTSGTNVFNLRVKDSSGKWGPVYKSIVYVDQNIPVPAVPKRYLVGAEYFWGTTDPGQGLGTPILASDGNLDEALEQFSKSGLRAPLNGKNVFSIRAKDKDGKWGPVFKSIVKVDTIDFIQEFPKRILLAAEYFWGPTDPGSGNGIPILSADGSFDEAIEQFQRSGISIPNQGSNMFNIRVKDMAGKWGPLYRTVVYCKLPDVPSGGPIRFIAAGEYFWGTTDPGTGHGTPLISFDGNFNSGIERFQSATCTAPDVGLNLCNVRMRDNQGRWGPLFKSVVNVKAPAAIVLADQTIDCRTPNGQVTIGVAPLPGVSYSWSPGGATTSYLTIPASQVGRYCLTATTLSSGYVTTACATVTNRQNIPLADAGPDQYISCTDPNAPVTLGGSLVQGYSYVWSTTGQTTSSITVPPTPVSQYILTVTDSTSGCSARDTVRILPPPSLTATAMVNAPIDCFGGVAEVDVQISGGVPPYIGDGINYSGAGTWSYTVVDANGCLASTSPITLVEPLKLQALVSTSPDTCFRGIGSATATAQGGTPPYSFNWSNGRTSRSISGLPSGIYSVTISDQKGCVSTATAPVGQVGNSLGMTSSIVGPTGVCRSSTAVFSVPSVLGATGYSWILPAGATGTSQTNSITITFSNTYNGGFLCVTPYNLCANGTQTCLNVPVLTVKPSQPGPITVIGNLCGPSTVSCSVAQVANATNYLWSVSGTTVSIVSGQGTRNVQLSIPAGFTNAQVSVFAYNCIGASSSMIQTLIGQTVISSALTGSVYLCAGSTQNYSVGVANSATGYTWSITGDATILSTNANTCVVRANSAWNGGVLTVGAVNNCGTSYRSFTLYRSTLQPGAITGPNYNLCFAAGVNSAAYSISPVSGASSYTWSAPTGMTISGQGGTSITASIGSGYVSGNVCVTASNFCGASSPRCLATSSRPAVPTAISGSYTPCKTETTSLYTATPVTGATGYSWSATSGVLLTPVSNTATANFNSSMSASSTITVTANNACGAGSPLRLTVSINALCRDRNTEKLNVYPNPTGGAFILEFNAVEGDSYWEIIGMDGQLKKRFKSPSGIGFVSVDISEMANGVYQLRGLVGNTVYSVRVVKQD